MSSRDWEKSVPEFLMMMLLWEAASLDSVKLKGVGWKAG